MSQCRSSNKKIGSYSCVSTGHPRKRPLVEGELKGKKLKLLLDSGAKVSVLSSDKTEEMNVEIISSKTRAEMLDGSEGEVQGVCKTDLSIQGRTNAEFIVSDIRDVDGVLGIEWLYKNKAIIDTQNGTIHWNNGEAEVFFDTMEGTVQREEETINTNVTIHHKHKPQNQQEIGSVVSRYAHLVTQDVKRLPGAEG